MRFAPFLLGFLIMPHLYAEPSTQLQEKLHKGYSGFSEVTIESGNTSSTDIDSTLEQWNEIIYTDLNTQKEIGTQFSLKAGKENSFDSEIYQLYLKRPFDSKTLIVGRFDQIDARGYYTLDGFSLKPSNAKNGVENWWFYMGSPKRIDAYEGVDGGWLMGAEKQITKNKSVTLKQLFRVGFQQQWDESAGSYLNLGFSQLDKQPHKLGLTRLDFSGGLRLDETSLENFIAKAEYNLEQQGHLYLSYDHYRPPEKSISFHDRFYQSYAQEKQSVLRADWHKRLNPRTTLNLQARQVWHEKANNGQSVALGLRYIPRKKDWKAELHTDVLQMGDDQSRTLYAKYNQTLSSVLTLELEGMTQQKETLLTGNDNSQGVAFRLKKMLKKNLHIETYGEYINHSDKDNEYQLGVRLRRDFHNLPWKDL